MDATFGEEALARSDESFVMPMPAQALSPTRSARANGRKLSDNRLLNALPSAERARLLGAGKQVDLQLGEILYEPGQRMRHVWFPFDGFISLSTLPEHSPQQMEIDLVGNEGMLGAPLVLGIAESSQRALVLEAGTALRLNTAALRRELQRDPALRRLLNRYIHVLMMQLVQNATCVAKHKIEQRLARLLLMSRDRASSETLNITQACLATMLGVRRVGVTEAAGMLQRRGLIHYTRGHLAIIDHAGLEHAACGCYHAACTRRQRWLG